MTAVYSRQAFQRTDRRALSKLTIQLESAFEELIQCIAQVEEVLDQPELDRGRLTTVRLKVAQLRLRRAMLIGEVASALSEHVSQSERELLHTLRTSNDEMLRIASAHTTKWDLDTIASAWEDYRETSSRLVTAWKEKVRWEQAVLYPLLKSHAA